MASARAFECPNCGGSLEYKGGSDRTINCPYCGASVIVPKDLRTSQAQASPQVVINLAGSARQPAAAGSRGLVIVIALIVLAVGAIIPFMFLSDMGSIIDLSGGASNSASSARLSFGSEGIGPGLFTDARYVTIDGDGNIYVGEYSDGRIQVFSSSGEFIAIWYLDNETPLRGLAAKRNGTLYAVYGGSLYRYDGMTGQLLGRVNYERGFDDVMVGADGSVVTAWYSNRDDIVRFDSEDRVTLTITGAISGQSGDSELDTRVAVDGLGNIYALGTFNNAVFKFSPDGRYLTRFGGEGDAPGQFRAPYAITADGQGRVYVADIKGIQVFDSDGRYIDVIKVDGPAFGMTFNGAGELVVAARTKVHVITVSES